MKWQYPGLAAAMAALAAPPVFAQSRDLPIPPAASTTFPAGISIKKTLIGDVYVDAQGRTLYGLATGNLRLDTRSPNTWCSGACLDTWQPVTPPPGTAAVPGSGAAPLAQAAGSGGLGSNPDWMYVDGVNGPQLMYKRANLVYVRKGDLPGSTKYDGEDNFLWNVLRFVPPVPKLVAPNNVVPLYVGGAYAMAIKDNNVVLYTCAAACAKAVPFKAGIVAQGVGDWTVSRSGDTGQWEYKGKPVFVSQGPPKSASVPVGAAVLRPDPVKAPASPATPMLAAAGGTRPAAAPRPAYWSSKNTLGALLADPAAKAVVAKYFPEIVGNDQLAQAGSFTLKDLQGFLPGAVTDRALVEMDAELAYVPAPKG